MQVVSGLAMIFSVLVPAKVWYAPGQAVSVSVKSDTAITLMMSEFSGKGVEPEGSADVAAGASVQVAKMFPQAGQPGTYVLYAVPRGKSMMQFVGTPLVIAVKSDTRPGANPNQPTITRVQPLRYGLITTDQGTMTLAFYYDAAPNTVNAIQTLAEQGFYDGLTFHRVIPDYLIQGGDPQGDGRGGPGFQIDAEFSDKKHEEGVVSMGRASDPLEVQGLAPRSEYANSAGSQFFICLKATPRLDGRYTAFAKVVGGMEAVKAIAATPVGEKDRPKTPPVIRKFEILPVSAENNPYRAIMNAPKTVE